MTTKTQDNVLTTVWVAEFVNNSEGVCSLCGNTGFIDTTQVKSPRGAPCGRVNFCICPNGRKLRGSTNISAGEFKTYVDQRNEELRQIGREDLIK